MTPVASSHVRAIADPTKRWSRPLGAVINNGAARRAIIPARHLVKSTSALTAPVPLPGLIE